MRPKWHVFYGLVFSVLLYFMNNEVGIFGAFLIFLASFLIDFDHYLNAAVVKGKWNLKENLKHHDSLCLEEEKKIKSGVFERGPFHIFHTVEFHLLVFLLSFIWFGFFYIFVGMAFHSILDIIYLGYDGKMHRREFFLTYWLWKNLLKSRSFFVL